jgi:chromosome segregation ATPase
MKKSDSPEISLKSTKDQILAAYNEALYKLNEKQVEIPLELKKKEEEKTIVTKAASHSPDAIVSDLSIIKLKTIKQLDTLSEELLEESQKLSDLRQAISSEQKHLEDLYQIKDTANTLAALFQTHNDQKEKLQQERDQQKQEFEEFMTSQRLHWEEENEGLKREFQEKGEKQKKDRQREEEEYTYTREMQRRKEMDDYHAQKAMLEKELVEMRENLQKREEMVNAKEQVLADLQARVDKFPDELKKTVTEAEEKLRAQILQQHDFESQMQQKELDNLVKFHNLQVTSLQGKIKELELLVKELNQKADKATENVQLIACRALDASAQRLIMASVNADDKVTTSQK